MTCPNFLYITPVVVTLSSSDGTVMYCRFCGWLHVFKCSKWARIKDDAHISSTSLDGGTVKVCRVIPYLGYICGLRAKVNLELPTQTQRTTKTVIRPLYWTMLVRRNPIGELEDLVWATFYGCMPMLKSTNTFIFRRRQSSPSTVLPTLCPYHSGLH